MISLALRPASTINDPSGPSIKIELPLLPLARALTPTRFMARVPRFEFRVPGSGTYPDTPILRYAGTDFFALRSSPFALSCPAVPEPTFTPVRRGQYFHDLYGRLDSRNDDHLGDPHTTAYSEAVTAQIQ